MHVTSLGNIDTHNFQGLPGMEGWTELSRTQRAKVLAATQEIEGEEMEE